MDNKNKKNNKKDKKGKNYSQYKYYEPEYYTNPITGFLITSNQNQEKNAVKDAYNFLNRVQSFSQSLLILLVCRKRI